MSACACVLTPGCPFQAENQIAVDVTKGFLFSFLPSVSPPVCLSAIVIASPFSSTYHSCGCQLSTEQFLGQQQCCRSHAIYCLIHDRLSSCGCGHNKQQVKYHCSPHPHPTALLHNIDKTNKANLKKKTFKNTKAYSHCAKYKVPIPKTVNGSNIH